MNVGNIETFVIEVGHISDGISENLERILDGTSIEFKRILKWFRQVFGS